MSPRPQAAQQGLSPCAGTTHPPRHPPPHRPLQLLCWLQMTHSQHPHQGGRQGQARGVSRGPLPGGIHHLPYMWINATKIRYDFVCLRISCSWKQHHHWYHHLLVEFSCKACSKTCTQQPATDSVVMDFVEFILVLLCNRQTCHSVCVCCKSKKTHVHRTTLWFPCGLS